MNPFDLRGPEFLFLYLILSAVVITALVLLRRAAETNRATKMNLSDPYLIASLRGGDREVIRVAIVSLIDRGLLIVDEARVSRAENASPHSVRHRVEKELIEKCATPHHVIELLTDRKLILASGKYEDTLKEKRLLPDEETTQRRRLRLWIAILILGGVSAIKIFVALERGHTNVIFLVILTIVAIVVAAALSYPRLTSDGAAMLADVQALYSGLKDRAALIRPGGDTVDAVMLASVFGVGMLPAAGFGYASALFPAGSAAGSSAAGSTWISSCGSSGGSSCSSGSSCGGGGCGGGCGGCGS